MDTDYEACTGMFLESLCNGVADPLSVVMNVRNQLSELEAGDVATLVNVIAGSLNDNLINNATIRGGVLSIIDSLLSVNMNVLRETSEVSETSNRIVGIFESISSQINLTDGMTFSVSQSKFSLIATEMEARNIPSAGFSVSHPGRSDAEATIPRSVFGSLSTTAARIYISGGWQSASHSSPGK